MAGAVGSIRVLPPSGKDEKPSGKDEKQTHAMDIGPDHPELEAPVQAKPSSAASVAPPVNLVAQRRLHNISSDLLGFLNGINRLHYLEKAMRILHEKGVEPGSEKAKANKEKAEKILKFWNIPLIPELRAKIDAADVEGAKELLRTLNLLLHAMDRLKHNEFERADRAIRKLGAYLVGDLEIAIRRGDYSSALVALEKGRNDVICLFDACNAEDDETVQAAVSRLDVPMFPELRKEIDAKNLGNAIAVLENYRREIANLQLAIKAMPDLARAQRYLSSLGVYIVGDLKVALFARNLSQAKDAFDRCRTDISHLKEAMLAIQPETGRPAADIKRAKSALSKLGVYLLGDLRKALEAGRLQIAAEALERARADVACVSDAINAIHPVDGSPTRPDLAKAAVAKLGLNLDGSLKTAVENRNLFEALRTIEAFREDQRKKSYQISGNRIGKGSYGKVYDATHRSTGRPVVIKKQDLDRAAQREADTFGLIQRNSVPHSVIPMEIYTSSPEKRKPHMNIVMPKHQVMKHGTTIPLPELRSMAFQGVGYFIGMKKIGKSHNDIKPGNLSWEAGSQHLAIFDYGLSLSFDDPKLSDPNTVIGTRPYQAPEYLLGYPLNDNPTMDLWSWGCTLIELYIGEHLFPRDSCSLEARRLHALAICDQIGHPSKEYIAKCNQQRVKEIFAFDADGNVEGVLLPHLPRWPNTTRWEERMRAKARSQGDDLAMLEELIQHISGLLDYADRRELRNMNFPNITMHLEEDLAPNQTIVIYPPDANSSTNPLLVIKGGIKYSCLHIPIQEPAEAGNFCFSYFEGEREVISFKPIVIKNKDWAEFDLPRKTSTPITTPLKSTLFSQTSAFAPLPSAASGAGSGSAAQAAALPQAAAAQVDAAPLPMPAVVQPQAAPPGKRKRADDGLAIQPPVAKRLDLKKVPIKGPDRDKDRDRERDKDLDIPQKPLAFPSPYASQGAPAQAPAPMEQEQADPGYPYAPPARSAAMAPPQMRAAPEKRQKKMDQISAALGNPPMPQGVPAQAPAPMEQEQADSGYPFAAPAGSVSMAPPQMRAAPARSPVMPPPKVRAAPRERHKKMDQISAALGNPPMPRPPISLLAHNPNLMPHLRAQSPVRVREFAPINLSQRERDRSASHFSPSQHPPENPMGLEILAAAAEMQAPALPLPMPQPSPRPSSPVPLAMPVRPGSPVSGKGFSQGSLLDSIQDDFELNP